MGQPLIGVRVCPTVFYPPHKQDARRQTGIVPGVPPGCGPGHNRDGHWLPFRGGPFVGWHSRRAWDGGGCTEACPWWRDLLGRFLSELPMTWTRPARGPCAPADLLCVWHAPRQEGGHVEEAPWRTNSASAT